MNITDLIFVLIWVILLYYFMQLNFNLISHNFGLRGTEVINKLQFYWILSFLLLYNQYKIIYNSVKYLNYIIIINTITFYNSNVVNIMKILGNFILIVLILLVGISYYPIILNFILNITGITISNIPNYIALIVTYLVIFLTLNFINAGSFYLIPLFVIVVSLDINTLSFIVLPLLFKNLNLYLNHKYIFIFILVSFISYYKHSLI